MKIKKISEFNSKTINETRYSYQKIEIGDYTFSIDEFLPIYREYCSENNVDDIIYFMDEFNELFFGSEPIEILDSIILNKFKMNDKYFTFDGYGYITISDYDIENYLSRKIDEKYFINWYENEYKE